MNTLNIIIAIILSIIVVSLIVSTVKLYTTNKVLNEELEECTNDFHKLNDKYRFCSDGIDELENKVKDLNILNAEAGIEIDAKNILLKKQQKDIEDLKQSPIECTTVFSKNLDSVIKSIRVHIFDHNKDVRRIKNEDALYKIKTIRINVEDNTLQVGIIPASLKDGTIKYYNVDELKW